jgi:hypothetical protein
MPIAPSRSSLRLGHCGLRISWAISARLRIGYAENRYYTERKKD